MANSEFIQHKQWFFSAESRQHPEYYSLPSRESYLADENQMLEEFDVNYRFLLKNHHAIEIEFTEIFAVLQQQRSENHENNEAFWYYCSYCALLLETFHSIYSQQEKAQKYRKIREDIKNYLTIEEEKYPDIAKNNEPSIKLIRRSLKASFRNLLRAPLHAAQLREYANYTSALYSYWVSCDFTFNQGLLVAKNFNLLASLYAYLNQQLDNNKMNQIIQTPIAVKNYFMLGFILIRFIIDSAMLLKHTFSNQKKEQSISRLERFQYEWDKRQVNLGNTALQFIVSFLTSFNQMLHITSATAGNINAVFLFFNVFQTLYQRHSEERVYLNKKEDYKSEIRRLMEALQINGNKYKEEEQIHILKQQLKEHKLNWQVKKANFDFHAAIAALMLIGFTCSMIATPGVALLACYLVSTLARAMYFSAQPYTQMEEKSLRLAREKKVQPAMASPENNLCVLEAEFLNARKHFIFDLTKNITIPLLFIATLSTCWPAAIALSVVCVAYEVYSVHQRNNATKLLPKPLELKKEKLEEKNETLEELAAFFHR